MEPFLLCTSYIVSKGNSMKTFLDLNHTLTTRIQAFFKAFETYMFRLSKKFF